MKNLSLSIFLFFISLLSLHAQETATTYRKEKMNVMGVTYSGYSTTVPYSDHKTKQYLVSYLNENGKIRERKNFIEIKEAYWKSKNETTTVYALVNGDSTQSRIWIGHSDNAGETITSAIKGEMENLPFLMHKYHLQNQVKEAEEAASFLSKEIKNTERDGQKLNSRLEQNAREKIRLEQALEQNAKEKIQLEEDIVMNGITQKDKNKALEEVSRQLEHLKERLSRLKIK